MRIINAFKIISHDPKTVEIQFNQSDPKLKNVYGQSRLYSSILLPHNTISELRVLYEVNDKVSDQFFLEKIIRSRKGIDKLMNLVRIHKMKYKLSAHTHC